MSITKLNRLPNLDPNYVARARATFMNENRDLMLAASQMLGVTLPSKIYFHQNMPFVRKIFSEYVEYSIRGGHKNIHLPQKIPDKQKN